MVSSYSIIWEKLGSSLEPNSRRGPGVFPFWACSGWEVLHRCVKMSHKHTPRVLASIKLSAILFVTLKGEETDCRICGTDDVVQL